MSTVNTNTIDHKIEYVNEYLKENCDNIDIDIFSYLVKLGLYEYLHQNYSKMQEYFEQDININKNVHAMWTFAYLSSNTEIKLKYWTMAADEYKCINSMHELANYYRKIYAFSYMQKYYLMIIENCDKKNINNNKYVGALYHLALYHQNYTKNYNEMIKYFNICIRLGLKICALFLGDHYRCIKQNYTQMIKYYKIAIKANYVQAIHNLACYYKYISFNEELMIKYYMMAIEKHNYVESMEELADYYKSNNNIEQYNYFINLIFYHYNHYSKNY